MAHFTNHLRERISGQIIEIRNRGEKFIYVWGGAVNGRPLNVFASDPRVLQVTEVHSLNPQYRKFSVRALQDVDDVCVYVGPTTNAGGVWDTVRFRVNTDEQQNEYNRNRVIQVAASFIGCHYVSGSSGEVPDGGGGIPGKRNVRMLRLDHPPPHYTRHNQEIDDNAAWTVTPDGLHICAGKAWPYGMEDLYVSRPDLSLEDNLRSYRNVYIKGVRKGVVLGERCEGKRHFDCVGLITYCLLAVLGEAQTREISTLESSYANAFRRVEANDPSPDLPGDILIFGGRETEQRTPRGVPLLVLAPHIGFSVGNGREMIHAAGTGWGVVRTSLMGNLTRRVRHPRLG